MDDARIVELFWQRNEDAIVHTKEKYGKYLSVIAQQMLGSAEDSEEAVSDVCVAAWNSIPPHKPTVLRTYLAKLLRRIAVNTFQKRCAAKRIPSELSLSLDELEDCLPSRNSVERAVDSALLAKAISNYLLTLSPQNRNIFISRYYCADPVKRIAACFGMTETNVSVALHRTRSGLKKYLEQEGFLP